MSKSNLHIFLGKVFHKRVFPKNHEFLYNYKSLYMKDVFSFSHNSFYQQKDFFLNMTLIQSRLMKELFLG